MSCDCEQAKAAARALAWLDAWPSGWVQVRWMRHLLRPEPLRPFPADFPGWEGVAMEVIGEGP